MARELRFGVRWRGRVSQRWTIKAMANRPDIYIASERTGQFLHISLHDPLYGMHVKVTTPEGETHVVKDDWPPPLADGVQRVAQIAVPPEMATYPEPESENVMRVQALDDPEVWISFDVIVEEPGAAAREAEWKKGSTLVGRIDRSDGGTVAVVASGMRGGGGSLSFKPIFGTAEAARDAARTGRARLVVHGRNPDGSLFFLELRSEAEGEVGPTT